MNFPKNVILGSVAQRKNDQRYGLEFVEELGNDDAGYSEMVVVIFKYKEKYYGVEIQRINGKNNYDDWKEEINCPEVVRKEVVQHYWEELREKQLC